MESCSIDLPVHVQSIWRYPVKSMAGEELSVADVTPSGLWGDRAYALVDAQNNKVGTAKKWPELLQFRARFTASPQVGIAIPAASITLPDGTNVESTHRDADSIVSAALGHSMTLASRAPEALLLEFAAGTLGGQYANVTEMPVAGAAPRASFFDYAVVHLLTTSTLRQLHEHHPQGRFDVRRFRPNIVVETEEAGFIENSWLGRTLAIGDDVQLRVSIPCPRCVMTTLPQGDLPHDPTILKTAVHHNRINLGEFGELPCVGVYADVVRPGVIRPGDCIRLLN